MTREDKTVPDWQLERFRLGELPPAEQALVGNALDQDPTLRERLNALERSDADILLAHPPHLAAAVLRSRLETAQPAPAAAGVRLRPALAVAVAAIAVGAGLLVVNPRVLDLGPNREVAEQTRVKGLQPHLLLYRETAGGPEPLADGGVVRKSDLVQIFYQSAGHRYGVILSADGRGVVTVHLPAGEPRAARLAAGKPVPLATAYELDDAPVFERFYLVTSEKPFEVGTVAAAVRSLAQRQPDPSATVSRLDLPSSFDQSTFTLRKDVTR
jgi:hypothetical protein